VVLAFLAIAAMLSVEHIKLKTKQPYYAEKMQAALAMKTGMEVIKRYRLKNAMPIDTKVDPAGSGLIGLADSPITSAYGYLPAKQTTINPNWAAVILGMFKRAGVKSGDVVAMGFSGSFPAINLAALTAADVLNLKVISITSVSASNWGANFPNLTWLDMERILHKDGVISQPSVAASPGGQEDLALARSQRGRELLGAAVERNKVRFLKFEDDRENIDARMALYNELTEGHNIAVYVNVGGGTISVGTAVGKKLFKPGLNRRPPPGALKVDSVMSRFARAGVPVIHIVSIDTLADRYGLPLKPLIIPHVGEGQIFVKVGYNPYLVGMNLIILTFVLYIFLRLDIGYRIFGSTRVTQAPKHPEPMV
jgi:poly-gamma-glutamate system protein